ncbi:MAG: GDP-mannose 4,6-dehydratase [bacterium]|jgi:GDPmannose 4,6-dehydratase|nr:GDP-mannose 4,6-dehydratase [bacterium]
MKKTALITGILGQDGCYLARLLLEKGYKVYGLIRRYTNPNFANPDYLGITADLDLVSGDMLDEASLINIIKAIRPAEVYNLAAQSFVGSSWDQAAYTTQVNAMGVLYLLNTLKNYAPNARFYQASTSEMFGNSHTSGFQNEETPFSPRSPYATSKLYAHWLTINYRESYRMFCTSGILFNHESPIRGIEFVTRKISDGVARIKLGLTSSIALGTLDSQRDWGFAGDYVDAMWRMLQADTPETYVVATGLNHSIRDFLTLAFQHVGMTDWEPCIKIDPRFKRPAEVFSLKGDASKIQQTLGWKPTMTFEQLVTAMVDEDLKRLTPRSSQSG